jgi:hypothetical protein
LLFKCNLQRYNVATAEGLETIAEFFGAETAKEVGLYSC